MRSARATPAQKSGRRRDSRRGCTQVDAVPHEVQRKFGFTTYARQTLTLAWTSFRAIAWSRTGLTLVGALAFGSAFFSTEWMLHMEEIPLLPRTEEVLAFYAPSLRSVQTLWIIIPLLIMFYAGELVWRERDAGVSEIVDTAPVPEWALFVGKFLGLGLVVVAWMAMLMAAGMLVQVVLGYPEFDIGAVPARPSSDFSSPITSSSRCSCSWCTRSVDQKHLGHVAALSAYGFIVFGTRLGIEHKLLIYGSDLGWSYTPMSGFGPWLDRGSGSSSIGPRGRCCSRLQRGCS